MKFLAFFCEIFAFLALSGCLVTKEQVQQVPRPPVPRMPVSKELELISCPDGYLRGSGLAADYEQSLNQAVSQIAVQIQSSVVSVSTIQKSSDINANGDEDIRSSYAQKSQVSAEIRNRQDVRVYERISRDDVVGVIACMSRVDAAKPYREDHQKNINELNSAMAVLLMTSHPLEMFDNYEKLTLAHDRFRASLQVLESLGFKENADELEKNYADAVAKFVDFKSKYKLYISGAIDSEEGKILFEHISEGIKIQSLVDACEVGVVLNLELSPVNCKEGTLGISCSESVILHGKSCHGESYFALSGTLKGIGRKDEDEARTKLLKNAAKSEFVAEWKKEINRWIAR